tara:strand:- start:322 stop:696 length:375 start_codon:yes stop_codon:yes gene_type:complete
MNIGLFEIFNLIIGFGILNVWLIRHDKKTSYRGGNAKNLKEEFNVYGLPNWSFITIGFIKISLAILLILGIFWYKELIIYASIGMAVLMLGAILMHLKVNDPFKKSLPALSILIMLISIIFNLV